MFKFYHISIALNIIIGFGMTYTHWQRPSDYICAISNMDVVGDTGVYIPGTCYDVKNTTLIFGNYKYINTQQLYDELSVNSNKLIVVSDKGDSSEYKCSSFPLSDDFLKMF